MRGKIVTIPVEEITDWETFHDVFARTMGFPDFYGRNMNAWIDCMSSVDCEDGMVKLTVEPGGVLVMRINNALEFRKRCPELYEELVECTAFVNSRSVEVGGDPVLALMEVAP